MMEEHHLSIRVASTTFSEAPGLPTLREAVSNSRTGNPLTTKHEYDSSSVAIPFSASDSPPRSALAKRGGEKVAGGRMRWEVRCRILYLNGRVQALLAAFGSNVRKARDQLKTLSRW